MRAERKNQPLRPHEELLRACVAACVDERAAARITELAANSEMDWQAFVVDAVRHGVAQHAASVLCEPDFRSQSGTPLLGRGGSCSPLPDEILACLLRLREVNGRRNEVLLGSLADLIDGFNAAEVPCLVLKGASLALTLYPDPAERPFADLDILVPDEHFALAGRIAETLGFRRDGAEPHARQAVAAYRADANEDILSGTMVPEYDPAVTSEILRKEGRAIKLEIHRSILRYATGFAKSSDMAIFWQNTQAVQLSRHFCVISTGGDSDRPPIAGHEANEGVRHCLRPMPHTPQGKNAGPDCGERVALTLSPEAMLVHLCIHAQDHGFARLLFMLDALRVISAGPNAIDWQQVARLSHRANATDSVRAMLALLRDDFQLRLPADGLQLVDEPQASAGRPPRPGLRHVFDAMRWSKRELFWHHLGAVPPGELANVLWQAVFPPHSVIEEVHGVRSPALRLVLALGRPLRLLLHLVQLFWPKRAPITTPGRPKRFGLQEGTDNS